MKNTSGSDEIVSDEVIVQSVRKWVETLVVELNLCPFAERELLNNRVRFTATKAITEEQLVMALQEELELLGSDPSIETTLLVHANVLRDFYDYNQFLSIVDALLVEMDLEGVFQIASFHPDYQFGGTDPGDVENYTNRSPYPMLHLLREASLERAIASHPGVDQIPVRNIALMEGLGQVKLQDILRACLSGSQL